MCPVLECIKRVVSPASMWPCAVPDAVAGGQPSAALLCAVRSSLEEGQSQVMLSFMPVESPICACELQGNPLFLSALT